MSKPEEIEVMNDNGPSAGQRLQQAREALKLSIDEVAERMRIGTGKVAALENGAINEVGAPVFAAGYIRAYARIVGLSADELIAGFGGLEHLNENSVTPASGHVPNKIGRLDNELPANFSLANGRRWRPIMRWLGLLLLLLVIVAAAFWLLKSGMLMSSESTHEHAELMSLPEQSSLTDEIDDSQMLAIPGQAAVDPERAEDASAIVIHLPLQIDSEQQSSVTEPGETVAVQVADAGQLNELSLQFQDDSWVEIYDARKQRLIHQLARAGQTHTLQGMAPFSLVLGYVPGVAISLNGEAVDLSGYQGRRLVHLTIGDAAANVN